MMAGRHSLMLHFALVMLVLWLPSVALAQNQPPVADAGEDQTVFLGSSANLHGTAIDPDDDPIVGWIWEIESSPAGSTPLLGAEFSADASFLADVPGDYALSLVAFDGTDWSLPDSVVVTYVENQMPIAVAAAVPITGTAPLTVQFDGTQSWDPEGAALIYAWEFGDGTAPTLDPAPVHTYQNPGRFFAQLAVEDDFGQLDFDTISIAVTAPAVPSIQPIALYTLVPGLLVGVGLVAMRRLR